MPGPPTIESGDAAAIAAEHGAFRRAATAAGVRYRERRSFRRLWNGLTIAVQPRELGKLRRLSGVAELYPVQSVTLPEGPSVTVPQMLSALEMTGADYVQHTLGIRGEGIRVGVIDTGVDYDHPDLGGDGIARSGSTAFPNRKVVAGWDFVGDADGTDPHPDPYPDDCHGHGTHVAGIVAAQGGVPGVAPGALIGAYRVFGCNAVSTTELIVAALERCLEDGMDVVNLSIGAPFEWPEYPTARAADRLVRHGVVVVAAQGNNGAAGVYAANAPGTGSGVIAVASFENLRFHVPIFTTTPHDQVTFYTHARGSGPPPTTGTFELARTRTVSSPGDACLPLAAGSLAGKVALIRVGVCGAHRKSLNAQDAGAAAVILYPDFDGPYRPDVSGSPAVTIPVVNVTRADGERLDADVQQGAVSLTWTISSIPNFLAGRISGFSAYGPAPELSRKPNLGAPGGSVFSTWPLELGGYLNDSGTSMSTPQVAGAVALLLEAKPRTRPSDVQLLLENSSRPALSEVDPTRLDHVHRQGAGLLDIRATIEATTRVEPPHLELGESEAGPHTRRLTIRNQSARAVAYTLEHQPAMATGPDPYILSVHNDAAAVTFDPPSLTVRPAGLAHLDVTIAPPATLPDLGVYGGYLVLRSNGDEKAVRIPYLGFKGDYQALRTLAPTAAGFPWVAKLVDGSLIQQPAGAVFTMVDDDVPWIAYHLAHQASELVMEVFDAASGKPWHVIHSQRFVRRNATGGSFFADPWDGRAQVGRGRIFEVPDGSYVLEISALRALGDKNNSAHWDTWTSPPFTIARRALLQTEWGTAGEGGEALPFELELAPVEPNPARGSMTFAFTLPHAGPATIDVFDVAGRRLHSWRWGPLAPGEHTVSWDGRSDSGARAPTGAVLVRLSAAGRSVIRTAVLLH